MTFTSLTDALRWLREDERRRVTISVWNYGNGPNYLCFQQGKLFVYQAIDKTFGALACGRLRSIKAKARATRCWLVSLL